MIQRIISRGMPGPERAALQAARVCGVATGGSTRREAGSNHHAVAREFGLTQDASYFWNALWTNVREADGTVVIGEADDSLIRRIAHQGKPVFHAGAIGPWTAYCIAFWTRNMQISTLNIIGDDQQLQNDTRQLILSLLQELGRIDRDRLPRRSELFTVRGRFYALAMSPRPRAWCWHPHRQSWQRRGDWKSIASQCFQGTDRKRAQGLLPLSLRGWVNEPRTIEMDLLEVLLRLGKPAEDLAAAGRWAVLRLLADAHKLLPRDEARWSARRVLLARRQRDIIAEFGFAANESAVRTLAKIPYENSTSLGLVLAVRDLLKDPVARVAMQRLRQINDSTIAVFRDPALKRIVSPRLLRELSDDPYSYSELARLKSEVERTGSAHRLPWIRSMDHFHRVLRDLEAMPDPTWPLPPATLPPVPGLIEALTGQAAIEEEGRTMGHCVANFAEDAAKTRCLLFRVLPVPSLGVGRATLELRPSREGEWSVSQLAGPANAMPSSQTLRLAHIWRKLAHHVPPLSAQELDLACRQRLEMLLARDAA